jgi:hypothetical protein
MANGFSFAVRGANATLTYRDAAGSYTASIRVKTLVYSYGVTSDESHARDHRAFYPHRRVQGQFSLTVDCLGYKEFKRLMTWLRAYVDTLLTLAESNSASVTLMDVRVPSRNFHKIGILTGGIDDHDQVGSMVFSPELVFVSLTDPADPAISLLKVTDVSNFKAPEIDANESAAFYPVTVATYADSQLYDDLSRIDPNAAILAAINNGTNFTPSPTGGKQAF